jgi:hypothetical protein
MRLHSRVLQSVLLLSCENISTCATQDRTRQPRAFLLMMIAEWAPLSAAIAAFLSASPAWDRSTAASVVAVTNDSALPTSTSTTTTGGRDGGSPCASGTTTAQHRASRAMPCAQLQHDTSRALTILRSEYRLSGRRQRFRLRSEPINGRTRVNGRCWHGACRLRDCRGERMTGHSPRCRGATSASASIADVIFVVAHMKLSKSGSGIDTRLAASPSAATAVGAGP